MSTFTYPVLVANPRGDSPPVEVKFLVDTGAMFTCLPTPQLETLGLAPQWRVPIMLADGRQEEGAATEILLTITGRTPPTPPRAPHDRAPQGESTSAPARRDREGGIARHAHGVAVLDKGEEGVD